MPLPRYSTPSRPGPLPAAGVDIEKALPIIQGSHESHAHLALLGDKALLFSESGRAFIMYTISGRSWIVMGDPIGPRSEWQELAWQFCELCDRFGALPVFTRWAVRTCTSISTWA